MLSVELLSEEIKNKLGNSIKGFTEVELDSIINYRLHVEMMGRQWKLAPLSERAKRNMAYAKSTLADKPGDIFSTSTDNNVGS